MALLQNPAKVCGWLISFVAIAVPALAHKTEVAGEVAATWHIDPNDLPKAGEPARAWIALTRRGGEILPLNQANCQLTVYAQPRKPDDRPILQPTLKPITAEQYQGIPGADLVFPKIGLYQLELDCTPQAEGDFQPFRFQHDVTIASGTPPPAPIPSQTSANAARVPVPSQSDAPNASISEWIVAAIVLVVLIGIVGWQVMQKRKQDEH
jgi:hypothetical protein